MPAATHHAATAYAASSAMVPTSAIGENGVDSFTRPSLELRGGGLLIGACPVVLRRTLRHQLGRIDDVRQVGLERHAERLGELLHVGGWHQVAGRDHLRLILE